MASRLSSPLRVALIGAGNLAWSLIPALQAAGAEVRQLISRDAAQGAAYRDAYGIARGGRQAGDLDKAVDLVLLTVSDTAIPVVAAALSGVLPGGAIVAHCSGSVGLDVLAPAQAPAGVCYPLQLFTRSACTPLSGVPFFLEGPPPVLDCLQPLAQALSGRTYLLDSAARRQLHHAAVWACNFPNLLYRLAATLMPEALPFDVYAPLIRQHLDHVFRDGPAASQTGPAQRGDRPTLDAHLDLLRDQPAQAHLYRTLSDLIRPGVWEGYT